MSCKDQICCEAINNAIGTFQIQLAQITNSGSIAIQNNFPVVSPISITRSALGSAALFSIAAQFRAAITRLIILSRKCDGICCESAANAIRDVALGFASLVTTVVADPNIPLQLPAPAPSVGPFNIAGILASLVGSAAFPPTTPGLPAVPVIGTLNDSINLIFDNTTCNNYCEKSSCKTSKHCRNIV